MSNSGRREGARNRIARTLFQLSSSRGLRVSRGTVMEYAAIGLAIFGAVLGLRFRFRALLPFALLVLFVTIFLTLNQRLGGLETVLAVLATQAILQGGYFVGVIIRALFRAYQRKLIAPDELSAADKRSSNSGSIASN